MRFEKKVVIVTGSGRGIGKAIAMNFSQEGAYLVINDIFEERAESTVEEINSQGGKAIYVCGDVSNSNDVKKLVDKTVESFGTVHILVNNAGKTRDMLINNMGEEDWNEIVNICLKGAFLCAKFVSAYMIKQKFGKIINISSRAYLGNPGQANYSAAKAGLIGLTKALAKELGRNSINVNAVAPGLIETDGLKAHAKYNAIVERAIKETPLRRIGRTEDVAKAVLFLASDESAYITGEVLHITGGRYG